jgi:4-hydroxybutyryl-CoA dehydratase/vinylacetyl-CoA-Delta-isomerase
MNVAATPSRTNLMSGDAYRESLREYHPVVYLDGRRVESVVDEPALKPGVNALAYTYDYALRPELAPLALATQSKRNRVVSRMLHVNESSGDLLNKLEAVRVLCQETGCAQRYLAHDAVNGIAQAVATIDDAKGSTEHRARFEDYLADVQDRDLSLGVAMTDAKGDRSKKPHEQTNPDAYVHVVERNAKGIVISGTKAIVTGAPYMHEFLVMPSRNLGRDDADFAVCCAVPVDAKGLTVVARPAGRPGEKLEHGSAPFSRKYGQSTGVVIFDRVFVPWERVFYEGEWEHSHKLTYSYATHHRHSCIAARAGFGDLLIGAGALMCEANGFDPGTKSNLREPMVELIKITEGFFACGVAASVYATQDLHSGSFMPEPVFCNIGKLLLATQIYDMHRLAHEVSGGLIVALPGPDEDHNPATAATLSEVLRANPAVPYDKRIETARFIEDLTASYQGGWYSVISLHGGGSPAAMKQEIWRNYPLGTKVELVERLLERGVLHQEDRPITKNRQPGRCCATGCSTPGQPVMVPLPATRGAVVDANYGSAGAAGITASGAPSTGLNDQVKVACSSPAK